MYSLVRIDNARIVHVGFLSACDTKGPPSATNKFLQSCAWHQRFVTEVFGSSPMRAPPSSWMMTPPAAMPYPCSAPGIGDAVPLFGARHRRERLTPHLRDERPEGLLHVLHLLVLVVGPLPVEPQNGDAPPVHRVRVDLAVGVVIGDHLAAAREADRGAVVAAVVVLELLAVAAPGRVALNPVQDVVGRQV